MSKSPLSMSTPQNPQKSSRATHVLLVACTVHLHFSIVCGVNTRLRVKNYYTAAKANKREGVGAGLCGSGRQEIGAG